MAPAWATPNSRRQRRSGRPLTTCPSFLQTRGNAQGLAPLCNRDAKEKKGSRNKAKYFFSIVLSAFWTSACKKFKKPKALDVKFLRNRSQFARAAPFARNRLNRFGGCAHFSGRTGVMSPPHSVRACPGLVRNPAPPCYRDDFQGVLRISAGCATANDGGAFRHVHVLEQSTRRRRARAQAGSLERRQRTTAPTMANASPAPARSRTCPVPRSGGRRRWHPRSCC